MTDPREIPQSDVHANHYRCSVCGQIYEKGWTDQEAIAEADATWGDQEAWDVVCDPCFNAMSGPENLACYVQITPAK